MSVLIEAITLVVPKQVLAVSYNGGVEAYVEALSALERPPRFICDGDAHLLNASFFDLAHMRPAIALLSEEGIVTIENDEFHELAFVDQRFGPTMPCKWLEWERHEEGYTSAWLSGTEVGELASPNEWTPEQSQQLTRSDTRDEPGRCLRLAVDNGIETWLDFTTGKVSVGLAQRDDSESEELPDPFTPTLIEVVEDALNQHKVGHVRVRKDALKARIENPKGFFELRVLASETTSLVAILCPLPIRVPQRRRMAVIETLSRANWSIALGNFELDHDTGDVRFRIGLDVEGGKFAPTMFNNMVMSIQFAIATYHDSIMDVAFGKARPRDAIAAAEGREGEGANETTSTEGA
jgi:hypothetical protein